MVEEFFRMAGSTNYHELNGQHGRIRQKEEESVASPKASPLTGNAKKKDKERRCRFFRNPSQLKSIPLATKGKTQHFRQEIHTGRGVRYVARFWEVPPADWLIL